MKIGTFISVTARGCKAALIGAGVLCLCATGARADFFGTDTSTVEKFAVLGQFSSGDQTNFNTGTIINGDIGIGATRQFTMSNASLVGSIRFTGAVNVSGISGGPIPGPGPYVVSGGGTVSGGIFANDTSANTALNAVNSWSHTLGGESSDALGSLTSSTTITASDGVLDAFGNHVFSTTNVNLSNATTLTFSGTAADFIVLNVTDSNPAFNGQIKLTGGITSDHVLINMYGGDYTTHKNGPTLTISTNGQVTQGIFLDPNGGMQINNSDLEGRFFGGDTTNQQIVSGADITSPTFHQDTSTPLPSTAFAGAALLGGLLLAGKLRRGRCVA